LIHGELTVISCISREIATLARFNPRGDLIYVGTNRGNINIWDVQTKEASHSLDRSYLKKILTF
jgi:WD40 repeat protein